MKPTWEFLWWNVDKPKMRDGSHVHARIYRAPTIGAAADKMLAWIKGRPFNVGVDYEAQALHERNRRPAPAHETLFPNLSDLDHDIREYVD